MFVSFLIFLGCTSNQMSEVSVVEHVSSNTVDDSACIDLHSIFLWDTPQDFRDYLFSNPIDIAMERDGDLIYTTSDIKEWVAHYAQIWLKEMDSVYESLSNQVSDESRVFLEQSQAAWEVMNQQDSALWFEIFYSSKGQGSGDISMVGFQNIYRIRQRTFLLAEYYFWLTGDFNFIWQG